MADFTPTQGRYLACIHAYTNLRGCPPAESEMAAAMCVSPRQAGGPISAAISRGIAEKMKGIKARP